MKIKHQNCDEKVWCRKVAEMADLIFDKIMMDHRSGGGGREVQIEDQEIKRMLPNFKDSEVELIFEFATPEVNTHLSEVGIPYGYTIVKSTYPST